LDGASEYPDFYLANKQTNSYVSYMAEGRPATKGDSSVTDTTSAAQSTRSGVPTAFADGATLASDISDLEERSIAFADADGWRCFYPESRGHLTAAEARAEMRAARGLLPETPQEREAAEFVLVAESAWFGDDAE
jgi:hypothetical protein